MIPYSSLGSGFLSGKYRPGADLPKTARAANVQKGYMNDRGFAVLAAIDKVADKPQPIAGSSERNLCKQCLHGPEAALQIADCVGSHSEAVNSEQ